VTGPVEPIEIQLEVACSPAHAFERTPEGVEHDWREVLAWEPPHRLACLWHLGTDRSRGTHYARVRTSVASTSW
jgi:hypothetical protein